MSIVCNLTSAPKRRPRKVTSPACTTINGWQVYVSEREFKRYASVEEYIAALEEIDARHPRYKHGLFASDRLLSFGLTFSWMWRSERWCDSYSFEECIRRAVAWLATSRRAPGLPITGEEAHLFDLFNEAGPVR